MPTAESVKAKLQSLINQANATTGSGDADLTTAVGSLIAGFGQGGGVNPLDYAQSISRVFMMNIFDENTNFEVSFGSKASGHQTDFFADYAFYRTDGLTSVKVLYTGNITAPYSIGNMFEDASNPTLTSIDLSGMPQPLTPKSMARTFYRKNANNVLREIIGEFDLTNCTNVQRAFEYCARLETVRFTPGSIQISLGFAQSAMLSDETIQSIIDGLADMTGGTAQTLTLHADVGAKLTEEQKAAVAAKNWTLAY